MGGGRLNCWTYTNTENSRCSDGYRSEELASVNKSFQWGGGGGPLAESNMTQLILKDTYLHGTLQLFLFSVAWAVGWGGGGTLQKWLILDAAGVAVRECNGVGVYFAPFAATTFSS